MSKFKYCVQYQNSKLTAAIPKLIELGYRKYGSYCEFDNGYIKCYPSGAYNTFGSPPSKSDFETQHLETFLAIAAINEDDLYHVGEHILITSDWSKSLELSGSVLKITKEEGEFVKYEYVHLVGAGTVINKISNITSGYGAYFHERSRKMTPEEIIEFYKNKQMTPNNDFVVTGSKHLILAFANELIDNGIFYSSVSGELIQSFTEKDMEYGPHITTSDTYPGHFTGGTHCLEHFDQYSLPQDWNVALDAFKALKKKNDVFFDLPYRDGVLKLQLKENGYILLEGEKNPFTIAQLKRIIEFDVFGQAIGNGYAVQIDAVNIGCKQGIKRSDLSTLLRFYKESFPKAK